ncbi:MAG: DUF4912 domain-containing protein [Treponema sp.]|jgi:hypothetical protein|nr:DUF4912 domain-containing protein [Treponema sp.]
MEQFPLVRPYLDSLTTRELVRMADTCGIDIPLSLERVFIIEELLDYARADKDGEEDEGFVESPDCLETAPVPRRYNVTFIDGMIRDPLWVFVFWEVKEHDGEIFEKDPGFSAYCLRVRPAGKDAPAQKNRFFVIQVDPGETARYLGFSEYPPQPDGFHIDLCAVFNERIETLAVSKVFCLPGLPGGVIHDREDAEIPPLLSLSGMNDFPIIRDTDRPSYCRFSCNGY